MCFSMPDVLKQQHFQNREQKQNYKSKLTWPVTKNRGHLMEKNIVFPTNDAETTDYYKGEWV